MKALSERELARKKALVLQYLRKNTIDTSCRLAFVPRRTFNQWYLKDLEFRKSVEEARQGKNAEAPPGC